MRRRARWPSWTSPHSTSRRRRRPLRSSTPGARSSRCSSSPPTTRSGWPSRSATSSASSSSIRPRSRWPRSSGRARCSSARPRSRRSRGGRHESSSQRGAAVAGGLREELQPDRGPQILVPRAQGRAQDAGPAGGRGAVRRESHLGQHREGAAEAEDADLPQGHAPRLEEGDRAAQGRRRDRDLRGGSGLMALKKFKPTSPGRRFMTVSGFEEVTRSKPEKSLTSSTKKTGGRNNKGRITTRHKGGGHKRRFRQIDFKRTKDGVPAKVAAIEYDPNRSANIALLHYADGAKAYILAPARLRVGANVESGPNADIKPGNALPLENIPTGTLVHNVELKPGRGGQMARSAGSGIQLVAKDEGYGVLRLPSGELRRVALTCRATVGQVGNLDHENISGGKAGRSRWRGKRPTVRGSAMNPVDHPHGGGEGKSKGGRHPVTPWGVPTLGKRTRAKHKESNKLIVRGRRRGKEKRK